MFLAQCNLTVLLRQQPTEFLMSCITGLVFNFQEMPVGGAALDLVGVPLPEESFTAAKQSDAILLGAIGGCVFVLLLDS